MAYYESLFQELTVGKQQWKNRIVMAPMGDGKAEADGSISEPYIEYYEQMAKGGCAVITPAVFSVDYPYSKPLPNIVRMDNVQCVHGLSVFVDRMHQYEAMVIPQLHHAGPMTSLICTDGNPQRCVSDVEPGHTKIRNYRKQGPMHELTTDEIHTLVKKFITSARYCQMAGCDGVTLHAGHGYLVSCFLSPDTNRRTDEYGGSFDNRMRFAKEIITGIRAACGQNFIIGARIPGADNVPGGMTQEEIIKCAQMFEDSGCDYLDISYALNQDVNLTVETPKYPEGFRVPMTEVIKKNVKKAKVGAVGVLRDPAYCDQIIREGRVDFVTIGRGLIADPEWPNKAKAGLAETIRPCLSCREGCYRSLGKLLSIRCVVNPVIGREVLASKVEKAEEPRKVLVIGSGSGGMEAAITAAGRGHNVTLVEAADKLGGQLNLACVPPNKFRVGKLRDWFIGELDRKGVTVKLNTRADMAYIQKEAPDEIIIAAGAVPTTPPIPGVESAVQSWEMLRGNVATPEDQDVVIIGGGIVGCEVAELMVEKHNRVTILDMLPTIAEDLEPGCRLDLMKVFDEGRVNAVTEASVKKITASEVVYSKAGEEVCVKADHTILAAGAKPVGKDLASELKSAGYSVHVVGDAKDPRRFTDAIREGFFAGNRV